MFFIYRKIGYVIDIKVVMKTSSLPPSWAWPSSFHVRLPLAPFYLGLFLDLFLTCIVGSAITNWTSVRMVLNGGVTKEDADAAQGKCPLSDDFSRKNALSLRQREIF